MARKLFIAANWKMNTNRSSAVLLARNLMDELCQIDQIDLAVCPPFVYIPAVAEVLSGTVIAVGAQDVFYENEGAFTGEVSAAMLKDVGCRYVIIGHSERRHVIGESDELINRKVLKALSDGLDVIFCVGELLAEREANKTDDVVRRQVSVGLEGVSADAMSHVTIAYEPVWAIGTGKVATPQRAQDVHAMIRSLIEKRYNRGIAQAVRIQYGGSVKPQNAREILAQPDVDGALVGGAALKAADFAGIVKAGL